MATYRRGGVSYSAPMPYAPLGYWGIFSQDEKEVREMKRVSEQSICDALSRIALGVVEVDEVFASFAVDFFQYLAPMWGRGGWPHVRDWCQGRNGTPRGNTCKAAFALEALGVPIRAVNHGGSWYHGIASVKLINKLARGRPLRLHTGHVLTARTVMSCSVFGCASHLTIDVSEIEIRGGVA